VLCQRIFSSVIPSNTTSHYYHTNVTSYHLIIAIYIYKNKYYFIWVSWRYRRWSTLPLADDEEEEEAPVVEDDKEDEVDGDRLMVTEGTPLLLGGRATSGLIDGNRNVAVGDVFGVINVEEVDDDNELLLLLDDVVPRLDRLESLANDNDDDEDSLWRSSTSAPLPLLVLESSFDLLSALPHNRMVKSSDADANSVPFCIIIIQKCISQHQLSIQMNDYLCTPRHTIDRCRMPTENTH
jgi:hypothetical protein